MTKKSASQQSAGKRRVSNQQALDRPASASRKASLYWSAKTLVVALLLCTALFIGSGPAYLQRTSAASIWLDELRSLPSETSRSSGTRVAIDGRIAEDSATPSPPFVAYVEETKRGSGSKGGSSWWIEEDRQRATFSVSTASGKILLNSTEYEFSPKLRAILPGYLDWTDDLIPDWDHTHLRREASPDGSVGHARMRGLGIGQPVLVVGRVADIDRIVPEYVIAGTRQSIEALLLAMARGDDDTSGYAFMMTSGIVALAALLAWLGYVVWLFVPRS